MSELMRLYNNYLGPTSDTLLDLGASGFRWNNLYLFGGIPGTQTIIVSNLTATSATVTSKFNSTGSASFVALIGTNITATSINATSVVSAPLISASSVSIAVLTTISSNETSIRFMRSVGSSIILSNSANAYLNVKILTHNAASPSDGDTWFQASSNTMYLAIRSNNANYYIRMDS
jgi:hypothetical protein